MNIQRRIFVTLRALKWTKWYAFTFFLLLSPFVNFSLGISWNTHILKNQFTLHMTNHPYHTHHKNSYRSQKSSGSAKKRKHLHLDLQGANWCWSFTWYGSPSEPPSMLLALWILGSVKDTTCVSTLDIRLVGGIQLKHWTVNFFSALIMVISHFPS